MDVARISRAMMFMDICEIIAKRSTCARGNVGALIAVDNNIISMGYNGPPAGEPHCSYKCFEASRDVGCQVAIHAEINAITRAKGRIHQGSNVMMFCTMAPCTMCASVICHQLPGVIAFYYRYPYRLSGGLNYLKEHDIQVYKVMPSGQAIDETLGVLA